MDKEVEKLFSEFLILPVGYPIEKPNEFIAAYSTFVFTRKTLKHFAEKGDRALMILYLIPDIIEFPDCILLLEKSRRMYVKYFPNVAQPYVVIIEVDKIIVTAFQTNKKYLKNFKILWRTESSIS